MPQEESITDLLARSKAVREVSRQTLDEASGRANARGETLDRSVDRDACAETEKATYRRLQSPQTGALEVVLLPPLASDRTRQRIADLLALSRDLRRLSGEIQVESGRLRQAFERTALRSFRTREPLPA